MPLPTFLHVISNKKKNSAAYTLIELLPAKQQGVYPLQKNRNTQEIISGYTLIELLIVISIMVMLFMGTFTSYRSYQRRQILETAVRQLTSDLRLAQQYSISGKKPEGSACDTQVLNLYRFVRISSTRYRIEAECGTSQVIVKGPVDLPSGTQMSFSTGSTIQFRVLGRGADPAQTITVSFPSGAVTSRQIQVRSSGEIQ